MPGRLFVTTTPAEIAAAFGADPGDLPATGPRCDVAPGESVLAVIAENRRRLVEMRWGLIGATPAAGR